MARSAGWLFGLAALLLSLAALRDAADRWVDATDLPVLLAETSVEIRDRQGALLRAYPVADGLWRLTPGAVDPDFTRMLIRYEDKRFRRHAGVDPLAMIRAAAQAVWQGRTVSGGSTLTMQVARLLEDGGTGRWAGKLRQIRVALALERRLDKEAILSLYLTHAPYGGNLEGVRAATLAWFGKEPRRLTPAQAALLVALPQSPETRRPDRYPDSARAARDRVVERMRAQGMLTEQSAAAALRAPVPGRMRAFPRLAPHLSDRVIAEAPDRARHVLTLDAGVQTRMQALASRAAFEAGAGLSVALVVAEHRSGAILASVGSPGYAPARQGFVDMTRALRSPGSTLKPLVYGLAFDRGLAHPETLIHDGPVMFGRYAPRNFDGQFRGDVRVREALQLSLNIPVVRLTEAMGPVRLMDALRRSGADPDLTGVPGLAVSLGGVGLSLRDLVQLYAGLANGGQAVRLHHLPGNTETGGRLISEVAAWQVGDILAGLAPPPGAPARALAYKTGTSYGHRDAWAVGYDGRHVIGAWIGRPDGTPVPGAFGGDLAAPVLFEAFGRLKPGFDPLPPPPPATLIVGAAELPAPLQRFRPRGARFGDARDRVQLLFPPDGARLAGGDAPLTVKLRGGAAPFTVLVDGRPSATGQRARSFEIPHPGPGFSALVVVDADGRSDRAAIRLD
ncbi:penicillin-binding protein 1C [Cribrihabitans marinus]|uniref:peptidoglycan glycosyltransferase n=1 Tax=Cribrihabitans marinus TaxID=1227549 RepID=A0A1H6XYP8_9RHOB|nr:penicillin-binding protein 1C [Cribrihabitans marinus]GGH28253.1 penicillin-binding protein 1C [Cribrihabitans marinus]SEJ34179.1 penicillin-binding protein 1C [Cribrihabitans marinus]